MEWSFAILQQSPPIQAMFAQAGRLDVDSDHRIILNL
jgi:hypothetical protein